MLHVVSRWYGGDAECRPGEGSGILDWGTAACGTSGLCRITLTADTTVNVSFLGGAPLFPLQWHLDNRRQTGGTTNEDVNVLPVWTESGIRGRDVRTVVVDDGLEVAHEDLAPNVVAGAGWNYLSGTPDPTPPTPSLGNDGWAGYAGPQFVRMARGGQDRPDARARWMWYRICLGRGKRRSAGQFQLRCIRLSPWCDRRGLRGP
jgi:hypothetical protein